MNVLNGRGLVLLVVCLYSSQAFAEELDNLLKSAKDLINTYSLSIQLEYEKGYSLNDPIFIKEICRQKAKEIAANMSRDGWSITRISMDYNNIDNAPDQTERRILKDFLAKNRKGKAAEELAWYKLNEIGNQSEFRYIRAFAMEERCMSCHSNTDKKSATFPSLAAYSVKKIETKDYFPAENNNESMTPLPKFKE